MTLTRRVRKIRRASKVWECYKCSAPIVPRTEYIEESEQTRAAPYSQPFSTIVNRRHIDCPDTENPHESSAPRAQVPR